MHLVSSVHRGAVGALTLAIATLLVACASDGSGPGAAGPTTTTTTTSAATGAAAGKQQPATQVQVELVDSSRPATDPVGELSAPERSLPTDLYLPAATAKAPLIVFAHGYDGDPSKFRELFTYWADAGFAVAAPRFPITATGATDGGVGVGRSVDFLEQPADLSFVLNQLLTGEYAERLDARRIGAAGLSLGGVTTWAWVSNTCCRDERPRAAIIMDGNQFAFPDGTYVDNEIPVLVYHADRDPALPFENSRAAYDAMVAPKFFVTIFGVVHSQPFEDSPAVSDTMVKESSTEFWRAYLRDDAGARSKIVATATVPEVSTAESVTR